MPSITYWSRLEPSPRSAAISESLAAKIRDPLWMLTRQWQFGEFHGEDAASPVFAQMACALGKLGSWSVPNGARQPLPDGAPLEAKALAEDFVASDLSLAVELGQVFEALLRKGLRPDLIPPFREAYPVAANRLGIEERDIEAVQFLQAVAGRGIDGVALWQAATAAFPGLPAEPVLAPGDQEAVRTALEGLLRWVSETAGRLGGADAPTWDAAQLEYDVNVQGFDSAGSAVELTAVTGRDGRAEWFAFDVHAQDIPTDAPAQAERIRRSVIPASVSFPGMPHTRWWAFETGTTNLSAIKPETRELAKLIVLDFMLVQSNDWYLVPLRQPLGTMCRFDFMVVQDVFGELTLVSRADGGSGNGAPPWTMFSTSRAGGSAVADFYLLPPTAAGVARGSDPLEEVRFLRDEMANMAWGVERIVQNGIGEPWPAHERSLLGLDSQPPLPGPASIDEALEYRIQSTVPEHWIPFLPVVVDPSIRQVQLERGVLLRSASEAADRIRPAGRVLNPTQFEQGHYRLDEQEIPRTGSRILRVVYRTRWTDGSTHVWVARRKLFGAQEERSGLFFDLAVIPVVLSR